MRPASITMSTWSVGSFRRVGTASSLSRMSVGSAAKLASPTRSFTSLQSQPSVEPRRRRTSERGRAQRHSMSSLSQRRISPRMESYPEREAADMAEVAMDLARLTPPGPATFWVQS